MLCEVAKTALIGLALSTTQTHLHSQFSIFCRFWVYFEQLDCITHFERESWALICPNSHSYETHLFFKNGRLEYTNILIMIIGFSNLLVNFDGTNFRGLSQHSFLGTVQTVHKTVLLCRFTVQIGKAVWWYDAIWGEYNYIISIVKKIGRCNRYFMGWLM